MTCIIGIKKGKKIYIGGDRRTSRGSTYMVNKDTKIIKHENIIMGACGHVRTCQLMKHVFKPPEFDEKIETFMQYLSGRFCTELRKLIVENEAYEKKEPFNMGSEIVIGYKERLFILCPGLAVIEPVEEYVCSGSGSWHASAVLDYIKKQSHDSQFKDPEKVIEEAIKIAAGRIWSVDDKIDIVSI